MKKNYMSPDAEMTSVELDSLIATSLDVIKNEEVEIVSEDEFLGRQHNNLWEEGEEDF
jgi:hypothetical protein